MKTIFNSFSERVSANWRVGLLAIGPVFRLGKSRINLEYFPKFGLANIRPPDQRVIITDANNESLLYQCLQSKYRYGIAMQTPLRHQAVRRYCSSHPRMFVL